MKTGIELIAEERSRQIQAEGFSAEHDKAHKPFNLIRAASAYVESAIDHSFLDDGRIDIEMFEYHQDCTRECFWPFEPERFKPTTTIRDLVKAGALIAAAIDRLQQK